MYIAVTDLGLSPQYFWRLTWYEWGFYSLKAIKDYQRQIDDRDFQKILTGEFMALFANANRDPKKTMPFKRSDFYPLSYDTQLTQEADPELFEKVARRLGSRIKPKDSGDK